ncbi:MAG: hypothetical protein ACFFER_12305, partial [Candidatus Thorarchaeota archaeon]
MTSAKAKKASKILGIVLVIFLPLSIQLVAVQAAAPVPIGLLDPTTIPMFVTQLTGPPPIYDTIDILDSSGNLVKQTAIVDMTEFSQQVLPLPFPQTPVWGYGGLAHDALTGDFLGYVRNQPGPTFEAIRGVPIEVEYQNKIASPHMFPVDPTLHWANPNNVPMGTYVPPFTPYPPGYPEAQSPVPLIPHLHGGEVQSTSDGHPEAWFTASGIHG